MVSKKHQSLATCSSNNNNNPVHILLSNIRPIWKLQQAGLSSFLLCQIYLCKCTVAGGGGGRGVFSGFQKHQFYNSAFQSIPQHSHEQSHTGNLFTGSTCLILTETLLPGLAASLPSQNLKFYFITCMRNGWRSGDTFVAVCACALYSNEFWTLQGRK